MSQQPILNKADLSANLQHLLASTGVRKSTRVPSTGLSYGPAIGVFQPESQVFTVWSCPGKRDLEGKDMTLAYSPRMEERNADYAAKTKQRCLSLPDALSAKALKMRAKPTAGAGAPPLLVALRKVYALPGNEHVLYSMLTEKVLGSLPHDNAHTPLHQALVGSVDILSYEREAKEGKYGKSDLFQYLFTPRGNPIVSGSLKDKTVRQMLAEVLCSPAPMKHCSRGVKSSLRISDTVICLPGYVSSWLQDQSGMRQYKDVDEYAGRIREGLVNALAEPGASWERIEEIRTFVDNEAVISLQTSYKIQEYKGCLPEQLGGDLRAVSAIESSCATIVPLHGKDGHILTTEQGQTRYQVNPPLKALYAPAKNDGSPGRKEDPRLLDTARSLAVAVDTRDEGQRCVYLSVPGSILLVRESKVQAGAYYPALGHVTLPVDPEVLQERFALHDGSKPYGLPPVQALELLKAAYAAPQHAAAILGAYVERENRGLSVQQEVRQNAAEQQTPPAPLPDDCQLPF